MHDFTPFRSLLGGVMLGVAVSLLALGAGRVAGISGILGGLFTPGPEGRGWRWQFLGGLAAGGLLLRFLEPAVFASAGRSLPVLVLAGLLVGFGARLGGGCTSGHGLCGMSRLSVRSLVATLVFVGTGMITVLVVGR
jgi:uncharacterized protein